MTKKSFTISFLYSFKQNLHLLPQKSCNLCFIFTSCTSLIILFCYFLCFNVVIFSPAESWWTFGAFADSPLAVRRGTP